MMLAAKMAARPLLLAAVLSTAALSLSACAPLVVGGAAATTAVVITDRRTSGAQVEDQNIAFKAERQISEKLGDTARVNAMVYNSVVLLTGDVPSDAAKAQAGSLAQGVQHVKSVVNQLNVGPAASFSIRSNDTWLTSKVRTTLINTKYVPSATIAVTTDRGVVYLMGLVTEAEGNYAATAASQVGGVAKVVKLFEVISREEALRLSGPGTQADGKASDNAPQQKPAPIQSGGGGTVNGVEAIPIK
ncbi:BON domain-containing protein [Bordetella petrii]|uniref:BON domain-containing protein n=1 Tax=Bordetella petrii TaxID=94624 RepID=UPI001E5AE8A5|nr:BON domain-containing protein [Bordetella petrii]MCD0502498.1 BON domain-containing protein [Bordetella petrii]